MAKYCSRCGQPSDDSANVCSSCGTWFNSAYPDDDEPATVVADEAYGAPSTTYQPEPVSQQPAPAYQSEPISQPEPISQQPAPAYQPTSTYQPSSTYQPTSSYQAPGGPAVAQPLNMGGPKYGVPLQQQGYPTEKKNKGLVLGIVIAASIVVIAAVILIIVLTSGGGSAASLDGTYYLNSETASGTVMTREDIHTYLGGDVTLTVSGSNGTLDYNGAGSLPITFDTGSQTVSSSAGNGTYSLSGNTLRITFTDTNTVDEFIKQ